MSIAETGRNEFDKAFADYYEAVQLESNSRIAPTLAFLGGTTLLLSLTGACYFLGRRRAVRAPAVL